MNTLPHARRVGRSAHGVAPRRVLILANDESDALSMQALCGQEAEATVISERSLGASSSTLAPPSAHRSGFARWLPLSTRWEEWWSASVLEAARSTSADFDVVFAALSPPSACRVARMVAAIYARPLVAYLPHAVARGRLSSDARSVEPAIDRAVGVVIASTEARDSFEAGRSDWREKPTFVSTLR